MLRYVMFIALTVAIGAAYAHEGHQTASVDPNDKELQQWIQGLKNARGTPCCSQADGFPANVEWDAVKDTYRVRNPFDQQWYVVPPGALLVAPNRLGHAMAWWYTEDGIYHIRCFLPGALL